MAVKILWLLIAAIRENQATMLAAIAIAFIATIVLVTTTQPNATSFPDMNICDAAAMCRNIMLKHAAS